MSGWKHYKMTKERGTTVRTKAPRAFLSKIDWRTSVELRGEYLRYQKPTFKSDELLLNQQTLGFAEMTKSSRRLPGTKHKVIGLVSGGKDSCFNLMHCIANGHELVAVATLQPELGIGQPNLSFVSHFSGVVGNSLLAT